MRSFSHTAQTLWNAVPYERIIVSLQLAIIALLLFANLKQVPLQQQIILSPLAYKNPTVLAATTRSFVIPTAPPMPTAIPTPTFLPKILPIIHVTTAPKRIITQPTVAQASAPVPASSFSSDQQYLLNLLNGTRSTVGSAALRLDNTLSACALSHAKAMAARGSIYHDLANDVCDGSPYKGENVGMATGSGTAPIDLIHKMMVDEKNDPAKYPAPNHYTVMTDAHYTHVGLGIYFDGTTTWVSEDFGSN